LKRLYSAVNQFDATVSGIYKKNNNNLSIKFRNIYEIGIGDWGLLRRKNYKV